MKNKIEEKEEHSDELLFHAAMDFNNTVCGIPFCDTVPCMMTNVRSKVTCPDCITIIGIWDKNKKKESKDESMESR